MIFCLSIFRLKSDLVKTSDPIVPVRSSTQVSVFVIPPDWPPTSHIYRRLKTVRTFSKALPRVKTVEDGAFSAENFDYVTV